MSKTANHRESILKKVTNWPRASASLLRPLPRSAMADEAVLEAVEVDPKKLISKNGVIGYEKPDRFQPMTNFDVSITGFVVRGSDRLPSRGPP